ncbi:MAG: GNAT family N-acetyltransferase [Alphaproteobacteria bacterium]|nr:GNAT family N-acetyltransferase [Alphaproteobacteria bacterium]NCQ66137.1 GNAT family N-acetyltransferase [Alphaproteobacteria bacterium]NCT06485.1 GNAT family N-acetyltransferase [Alphaproteobacteria bacterium]
MKKLKILFTIITFFISSDKIFASKGFEFESGQQFHRTKANSPVFLQFSDKVLVENYGFNIERPGFEIRLLNTRKKVGYISTLYKPEEKMIEISWVFINEDQRRHGYASHALLTVQGIFKKYQQFYPNAKRFYLTCGDDNTGMQSTAANAGFEITNDYFNPGFMVDFIKAIPQ